MTLLTSRGEGLSKLPPGVICMPPIREESRIGVGLRCRLTRLRFSTMTRPSRGSASMTRPCLPRSLPASPCTVSPFLIFIVAAISEDLGSQADDLQEVLLAQLSGDGPEDTRTTGIHLVVDD